MGTIRVLQRQLRVPPVARRRQRRGTAAEETEIVEPQLAWHAHIFKQTGRRRNVMRFFNCHFFSFSILAYGNVDASAVGERSATHHIFEYAFTEWVKGDFFIAGKSIFGGRLNVIMKPKRTK